MLREILWGSQHITKKAVDCSLLDGAERFQSSELKMCVELAPHVTPGGAVWYKAKRIFHSDAFEQMGGSEYEVRALS
jgi:hypothetical protein